METSENRRLLKHTLKEKYIMKNEKKIIVVQAILNSKETSIVVELPMEPEILKSKLEEITDATGEHVVFRIEDIFEVNEQLNQIVKQLLQNGIGVLPEPVLVKISNVDNSMLQTTTFLPCLHDILLEMQSISLGRDAEGQLLQGEVKYSVEGIHELNRFLFENQDLLTIEGVTHYFKEISFVGFDFIKSNNFEDYAATSMSRAIYRDVLNSLELSDDETFEGVNVTRKEGEIVLSVDIYSTTETKYGDIDLSDYYK